MVRNGTKPWHNVERVAVPMLKGPTISGPVLRRNFPRRPVRLNLRYEIGTTNLQKNLSSVGRVSMTTSSGAYDT